MSDITAGHITISLAGGQAELVPSLFAATKISQHFSGFQNAMNRVAGGDLEAITAVTRYGLGIRTDAEAAGLDEKVYESGILRLTAPVTEFLLVLANGGRPLDDTRQEPDTQKKDAA